MKPLTGDQIAEIERLEASSSAAPWTALPWRQDEDGERHVPEIQEGAEKTVVFSVCYDHSRREEEANVSLIVALRNAAPALLAELKELREKLEASETTLEDEEAAHQETLDLLAKSRAELKQ